MQSRNEVLQAMLIPMNTTQRVFAVSSDQATIQDIGKYCTANQSVAQIGDTLYVVTDGDCAIGTELFNDDSQVNNSHAAEELQTYPGHSSTNDQANDGQQ